MSGLCKERHYLRNRKPNKLSRWVQVDKGTALEVDKVVGGSVWGEGANQQFLWCPYVKLTCETLLRLSFFSHIGPSLCTLLNTLGLHTCRVQGSKKLN